MAASLLGTVTLYKHEEVGRVGGNDSLACHWLPRKQKLFLDQVSQGLPGLHGYWKVSMYVKFQLFSVVDEGRWREGWDYCDWVPWVCVMSVYVHTSQLRVHPSYHFSHLWLQPHIWYPVVHIWNTCLNYRFWTFNSTLWTVMSVFILFLPSLFFWALAEALLWKKSFDVLSIVILKTWIYSQVANFLYSFDFKVKISEFLCWYIHM